jgi:hypothetical protein
VTETRSAAVLDRQSLAAARITQALTTHPMGQRLMSSTRTVRNRLATVSHAQRRYTDPHRPGSGGDGSAGAGSGGDGSAGAGSGGDGSAGAGSGGDGSAGAGSSNFDLMASALMTCSRARVCSSAPQTLQIAAMTSDVGTLRGSPDSASEIVVGE